MKIKRYFAKDMRQAIRNIREEQGPDAVIMSNRKVDGGIEIIAAVDYDESIFNDMVPASPATKDKERKLENDRYSEPASTQQASNERDFGVHAAPPLEKKANKFSNVEWSQDPAIVDMRDEINHLRGILENRLTHLAWGEMARSKPERAEVMHKLADMGISVELSQQIASQITDSTDKEQAWGMALGILSQQLMDTDDDILTKGGVVALVGPTGVGKTTTVAKLAARFALRHGKNQIALISTDNYRIGAHDQLLTFGRILGVPAYVASNKEELHTLLDTLQDKRLILIDTAGMSQRDMRLSEQLSTLREGSPEVRPYLVMSANTQMSTLNEVAKAFKSINLAGCILTKLDEETSLGGALSAVIQHQLPIAYTCDGQRVPEDMQPARAHNLVSRALSHMQQTAAYAQTDPVSMKFNEIAADAHV